jgi:hypothetical protein
VPVDDIDERYLDRPYYIVPDGKAGADAFVVIRDAMKRKNKVALGRLVLSNREHAIALKPLGKGLLGTTLRYPYELRDEEDYFDEIPAPRISKEMIDLAAHILDTKSSNFDPRKFRDKYETALRALVKRKAAGETIEGPREEEQESNVINLMEALKRSLGRKRGCDNAFRQEAAVTPSSAEAERRLKEKTLPKRLRMKLDSSPCRRYLPRAKVVYDCSRLLQHAFEIDSLRLRRAEDCEDSKGCVSHDQKADVEVGLVDAICLEHQPRENGDQAAAIDL